MLFSSDRRIPAEANMPHTRDFRVELADLCDMTFWHKRLEASTDCPNRDAPSTSGYQYCSQLLLGRKGRIKRTMKGLRV